MQGKLTKELYRWLEPQVISLFPDAVPCTREELPPGMRVWKLNTTGKVEMFLNVLPSPKNDSFALEIAWTVHEKLPGLKGRDPDDDRDEGEMCFRLSHFWHPLGAEHRWYFGSGRGTQELMIPPPDESFAIKLESVKPQVEDAVAKLREYGVPYFKKIATRYGVELRTNA